MYKLLWYELLLGAIKNSSLEPFAIPTFHSRHLKVVLYSGPHFVVIKMSVWQNGVIFKVGESRDRDLHESAASSKHQEKY